MSTPDNLRGITDADRARTELYDTLAQLKDRLNYAQRVDDSVKKVRDRLAGLRRNRPVMFAAVVTGVALVAGVAVWGVASAVVRRLK